MAETLADVGPFLTGHLEIYKDALTKAVSAYRIALDESLVQSRSALAIIPGKVSEYMSTHPIDSYVENTAFRKALSQYSSDIRAIITNYIGRSNNGDSTRSTNAGNDFNGAMNDANTNFYDALNSVIIVDENYQTKYTDTKALMDAFTQSIIDSVTPMASRHQSDLLDSVNNVKSAMYVTLATFMKGRPLLRVSDYRYPIEIDFMNPVMVEVDVKNIGGVSWEGWLGVTVADEYYKKVEYLDQKGSNYTLAPGASTTLQRDIILPKTLIWKGKTLNLGKKLTYKVVINTIKT
jgi:hypothetical protein